MNRRQLLGSTAGLAFLSSRSPATGGKTPVSRVAHITDVHIQAGRDAREGTEAMFRHMAARKEKIELVLNTGDTVMAIDGRVSAGKAAEQIAVWKAASKVSPAPIRSCLGNHDIWSGHEPNAELPATLSGTALMVKTLEMPAVWYSFDHAGWHIIALNSLCDWPNYGYLTAEHWAWLKDDLRHTPKERPVLVLSHLPILSVTSSVYGTACKKGNTNVLPGVWQHSDCFAFTELFRNYPNVRLALSGHMHTQDKCLYRGVHYICGGAVSGAWWNGAEYGFPPCYGAINLYADGQFDYEFVDFGWKAKSYRGEQLPLENLPGKTQS